MGVDRETREDFFGQSLKAVVAGGQLEVHSSALAITGFVFDPNIRDGNLFSYDLQPVRVGDRIFGRARLAVFAKLLEIAQETLIQFVAEADTKASASLSSDLCGCLLIEPVEVCIVMGFARLRISVVEGLTLGSTLRFVQKAVSVFGEGEDLARTRQLMGDGLHI